MPRLLADTPPPPMMPPPMRPPPMPEVGPHGPRPTTGVEAQDGMAQEGPQDGMQQDMLSSEDESGGKIQTLGKS